jgi:hypothetical protein
MRTRSAKRERSAPQAGAGFCASGAVGGAPKLLIGGALVAAALLQAQPSFSAPTQINPPLGPYTHPKPADFPDPIGYTLADRVVLSAYFYWYDIYSKAHIIDADGSDALTDHPPTLEDFSYKSKAWHKTQLLDMMAAGIDVLLPVYWGEPSQRILNRPISEQPWSYSGLLPLAQARDELLAEGKTPPRIGMFYDTSTLQYNQAGQRIDLTTPYGREWFYESVRDFFSLIPARHWAMIEGKPIVFLYSAAFAANHDQSCIDYLRWAFAGEFGGHAPFIVREVSWRVQADNVYAWGGALGLKNPGVASLGPGYDDSAVLGRTPLVLSREGGAFFERNWRAFLTRPAKLVMIETWNEYHESTDIAASREYGRTYLELNRKYADLFKQGVRLPRPRGPYSDVKFVSVILQSANLENGLQQFDHADGVTKAAEIGGRSCRAVVPTAYGGRYVYFRIDDSFNWADTMLADVEVEYYDSAGGSFGIEYDGSDPNAPFQGAYTASKARVQLSGSNAWQTAVFRLLAARFLNSQNGGADFRLAVQGDRFYVRQLKVSRLGVPAEAGQLVRGCQQDFGEPLGANWTAPTASPPLFRQTGGLLRVQTGSQAGCLLLTVPGGDAPVQELLARVRMVEFAGANLSLGGLAVAVDTQANTGLTCSFARGAAGEGQVALRGEKLPPGPTASFAWQSNTWYWLRLRHQTNRLTYYPDLYARVWLADGETPEPDTWLTWWDYYPASSARRGWAGIYAGATGAPAVLEFDYFLLKSDGLPEITARLPARPPARPELTAVGFAPDQGFQLRLRGEPETGYQVEASTNLVDWTAWPVATEADGLATFRDASASAHPRRFYRAGTVP